MEHKLGALLSKIDVRDYKYKPAGAAKEQYPDSFKLWTPDVKDQGSVNSCVAHVAAELEEYFNHKEGGKYNKLSVGYVYGCRYTYKGEGMYLRDALKTLKDKGVCAHSELPYNEEVPKMIKLFNSKKEYKTDEYNKITTYFSITPSDKSKLKHSLMNCGPIMISVPWYDDLEVINGVINSTTGMAQRKENPGYHAILLCGWDDKKGWLIQNSWGKFWGNNGQAFYPFDYEIAEAWGVTDTTTNPDIRVIPKNKTINACSKVTNFMLNIFKKIT